jgi:raffinose/stachyose/melibiose transport system permease protein
MPYLLIIPGLAFYALFVLVPIVATAQLSFQRTDGLLPPVWVGFSNFASILTDQNTLSSFKVSLVMVFFSCLLPVVIALGLVGLIARTKVRGLSVLRFLFFLPYTVALAVVAIAWRWLYATNGSVNSVVGGIFGKGAVTAYLGDFSLALPALGIIGFWATFGFVVVMLLSGTQHISRELYEASRVDGAGPVREFFAVTLPGVRHELRVALVMTFIMAMRTFDLPLMTTSGGPGYTTTTPSLLMYQDVFVNGQIGQGAAIAVAITLIMIVGVLVINRLFAARD